MATVEELPRRTTRCDLQPAVVAADIRALKHALEAQRVTFNDVARAWFHVCDERISDAQRADCAQLYADLLAAFGEQRGRVMTTHFCRDVRIAAALTDIGHAAGSGESWQDRPEMKKRFSGNAASNAALHIEYGLGDAVDNGAREILVDCVDLHYRAIEFLTPKPRKICLQKVMNVVTATLGILEGRRCAGLSATLEPEEIACLKDFLTQAEQYYERSAQRQAQIEYLVGMACGLALLVVALLVLAAASHTHIKMQPLLFTPLAAGLGAFVSVLSRITRGQLDLVGEAGRTNLRVLGLIRPLLGALFGAAIYVLLAGGLLMIEPPQTGARSQLFFYIGIAFLAGFSERFAQDTVARAPASSAAAAPATPAAAPAPARLPVA
jgi:hypothetical protein